MKALLEVMLLYKHQLLYDTYYIYKKCTLLLLSFSVVVVFGNNTITLENKFYLFVINPSPFLA